MIYRIQQFYRGLFAKVTSEDHQFLQKYLTDQEIILFRRLRISEQRHCLNIAYDCRSVKKNNPVLIKAALLHDVGKVESNLTLVNKSLVVLIIKLHIPKKLLPKFLNKALYYKKHHPELGAKGLEEIGTDTSVVFLTRYHHRNLSKDPFRSIEYPGREEDLIEYLIVLQQIDEKN